MKQVILFLILFLAAFGLPNGLLQAVSTSEDELEAVLLGFDAEPEAVVSTEGEEEQERGLDELLSGFDEGEPGTSQAGELPTGSQEKQQIAAGRWVEWPAWLALDGRLSLATTLNVGQERPANNQADFRGLSRFRTTLALSGDIRWQKGQLKISGHGFYDAAYGWQGRGQYTASLLEDNEGEVAIDTVYWAGALTPALDFKIGRQVVAWGKSDHLRVTDILNPLDNRQPGLVDVKNRRLPVSMTKLDYYRGDWNLSTIVVHEVRFSKNPVYNSDFFPGQGSLPPKAQYRFSGDNQQYGIALNGIFSGWDLSLYGAWVFDDRAIIGRDATGRSIRQHQRISMLGISGNVALGNWLLKGEGAWFDGLAYTNLPGQERARFDLMAGVEYTGFSETVISLEIVNQHLVDFMAPLALAPDFSEEDRVQIALKWVRDFAHDTLQLQLLASIFGEQAQGGAFERLTLGYELAAGTQLSGGVIFYQGGNQGILRAIDDHSRVFLELSYAFSAQ